MEQTLQSYDRVIANCRAELLSKHTDYGSSWRILRVSSLTDQLFIKARRIRQIEEAGQQAVEDPVQSEYCGLINYSVMALIQMHVPKDMPLEISETELSDLYDEQIKQTRQLMIAKNTDYGEVWREMRITSLTDLILAKLLRIKRIEDNEGITRVSEGAEGNFRDIINYAAFAIILGADAQ